ncbi:MAG TPA: hypothetical protein DCE71_08305 [Parachlamydiales bacterium]|nr:hypothetical protein [Parachlamydiales bacterium]
MQFYPYPHCPNKYFIETGSYYGYGIKRALHSGLFEKIYSIEMAPELYEHCRKEFADYPQVELFLGDSSVLLSELLAHIEAPATFWLDSHYSSENTAKGLTHNPILHELDRIKEHFIKNHTIMIDDAKLFGTAEFDFIEIDDIKKKILEINPNYKISLYSRKNPDDMLLAVVPS